MSARAFRLGRWHVEPSTGRVVDGPEQRQLTPRAMAVLLALAERPGDVVSRQVLHDRVWGDRIVGEDVQRRAIAEVRRVLGDEASNPRFIETLPRRGYRLVESVLPVEEAPRDVGTAEAEAPGPGRSAGPSVEVGPRTPSPAGRRLIRVLGPAAVVLCALAAWAHLSPRAPANLEPEPLVEAGHRSRPLTALPGRESLPALSPDGRRLAFRREVDGAVDLWLQASNADTPVQFTDDGAREGASAFAPDGESLAYGVRRDAADGERYDVVLRPVLGGDVRTLASFDGPVLGLDFSPVGDSLVVSVRPPGAPAHLARIAFDGSVRPLTRPPATVVGDVKPAMSPDGGAVVFVRAALENAHDLYRVELSGDDPARRLTRLNGKIPGVAWSSSGIFFTRFPPERYSLWRLDPVTGEVAGITLPVRFATHLAAAGGRVVLVDSGNDADIGAVSFETGAWRDVMRSTVWDASPSFSARHGRLAFVSTRTGGAEIWTGDRNGGALRRWTRLDGPLAQHPSFSPDGRWLAYDVPVADRSAIRLAAVAGGAVRTLGVGDAHERLPSFSLDGLRLYYLSDRGGGWGLWRRRLDESGPGERLVAGRCIGREDPAQEDPARKDSSAPSPPVVVVACEGDPGLRRLGLNGRLEPWSEAPRPITWRQWALDASRVVAVVAAHPDGVALEQLDRRSGRRSVLGRLDGRPLDQALALGDGEVYVSVLRQLAGDLHLVEGL